MSWKKDITENATFLFSMGFQIVESRDEGMGKIALIASPVFDVRFIYDKGPVHCDITTKHGNTELIHLVNYLNGKSRLYEFPEFYWEGNVDCSDKYIQYFDSIIKTEFIKITEFIQHSEKDEFDLVEKYGNEENMKCWEEIETKSHKIKLNHPWLSRFLPKK